MAVKLLTDTITSTLEETMTLSPMKQTNDTIDDLTPLLKAKNIARKRWQQFRDPQAKRAFYRYQRAIRHKHKLHIITDFADKIKSLQPCGKEFWTVTKNRLGKTTHSGVTPLQNAHGEMVYDPEAKAEIQFIAKYLYNRTFRVRCGSSLSSSRVIEAGISQGSGLGPTLYSIYVQDLPKKPECLHMLYADDTVLYTRHYNIIFACQQMQAALDLLTQWSTRWRIKINGTKSQAVVFTKRFPHLPEELTVQQQNIPFNSAVKYLGVYLDRRLTYRQHINLIRDRAFQHFMLLYPLFKSRISLKAEQSLKVEIIAVFTHQLHPYPAYIVQDDKQLVNYTGNYYFYSPYFSVKQTTVIACSSDRFESYSVVEPTSQFKNVITYGPYKNIPPFSIQKQTVHYENNESFLTITNMERVITVSHWGNIAVEETIELLHKGAILTGKFSRYDYEENRKKFTTGLSSISTFTTILPASAKDIYYKDMIGNVSSSRLRILSDSIEMQIQPRFPLYGGWKISYTIGYNLPSYEYLYNNGEDYALRMRVLDHVYDNMVVDELVTKIILPEHCTDIWLFTPYPMTRLPDTKYYSYLDIVGRPVIIVAKGNMVVYHIQDFELHYVFPYSMMVIEPLLIIAVLFFVLVLVIIIIRLDFSIASSSDFETSSPMQSLSSVQKKARCKSVMKE
ncbi:hypothetical protein ANN_07171 [Periplaneta americana]|uniref:Dolichyl-diphosphooligosaccharide--protein glycosyltransferase subunit 1 n=1 Tax=Periplaneta americana TaxID=6978 RepID=A0ABQ8THF5_PERAM|nr:hypothetical protein ANN_07171 [Periplaneta americana]